MTEFTLHPQLEADTFFVKDLALSRVLLMNNALFPWLILVPRKNEMVEWFDLDKEAQLDLTLETNLVAKTLKKLTSAKKINIANLGNMVPQLHVHVIARFELDKAWPAPVWGKGSESYEEIVSRNFVELLKNNI